MIAPRSEESRTYQAGVIKESIARAKIAAKSLQAQESTDPRIAMILSGDRRAAHDLLTELAPRVANLVRYLIGRDADTEDITQRVLVEVLYSLHTYRGESKFTTWTDRITIRTTLSHVKRRRLSMARLRTASAEIFVTRDYEPSENPEQYFARRQAVKVLDGLPREQRTAVILHYMVGLSVPELAEHLGVPFETVRSRLRIGMQKLRKRFGMLEDVS
jgi:RNA polymerase sigma-70 factor (ECF subfamily)